MVAQVWPCRKRGYKSRDERQVMREISLTIYSEREDRDIEVLVTYQAFAHERGCRDSLGVPEEPDTPQHVEIETILDAYSGMPVDADQYEYEEIYRECYAEAFK